MPTFLQDAHAVPASSPAASPARPFWPRELVFSSPSPNQLPGGWQMERAPMCPCNDCWESGSPYHVPRPKKKKVHSDASTISSTSSSVSSFLKRPHVHMPHMPHMPHVPHVPHVHMPHMHFSKKHADMTSTAAGMAPLHKSATENTTATAETMAPSCVSVDYEKTC